MFAVEVYAAVRHFVMIEGNSQRDAAWVFGLSRETIAKMCRFSLPPGYTRTKPVDTRRRTVAASDTPTRFAGHLNRGRQANHALEFNQAT